MPKPAQLLAALHKARSGELSMSTVRTLHEAKLIRAVLQGSPESLQFAFITFDEKWSMEAVSLFNAPGFLPDQASMRFVAGTLGIDVVISGQMIMEWLDQEIWPNKKYSRMIVDSRVVSYKHVLRYRWQPPTTPGDFSQPLPDPSLDDVKRFLKEDRKSTRLVYDLKLLPILSGYALIDTELPIEHIWSHLGKHSAPIRDLFHKPDPLQDQGGGLIKESVARASCLAICEFDSFENSNREVKFASPMNEAHRWRTQMMALQRIDKVSVIPSAVIRESFDMADDLARLRVFKPAVCIKAVSKYDETRTRDIPFPVWTSLICGGPRSGKSMTAYYIMSAFLKGDPAHDVIFVNFKAAGLHEGKGPAMPEAVEFARMIHECTDRRTRLVIPRDLEKNLAEANGVGAYYTEAHEGIGAEYFVKAIFQARQKQNEPRHCLVVFDEVLNQQQAAAYMRDILFAHNKYPGLNLFTGVIGHQLDKFWELQDARKYAQESTTVVAGPISDQDVVHFEELRKRAKTNSPFNQPVSAADLAEQGKGKFIFLPFTTTKQEQAVRVTLPKLNTPFRDNAEHVRVTWKWGTDVAD